MPYEYPKNYVVFDFETTGLDPRADKPIEVAWIVVKDAMVIKARRYFLNWQIDIPEKATEIHGITKEMILESPDSTIDPQDILRDLMDDIMASEAHVTHNGTNFDIPFLFRNLATHVSEEDLRKKHVDTAAIFKGRALKVAREGDETLDSYAKRVLRIHSTFKYNLRAACEAHGIAIGNTHRAMDDVMLTHALYSKMCLKV